MQVRGKLGFLAPKAEALNLSNRTSEALAAIQEAAEIFFSAKYETPRDTNGRILFSKHDLTR